MKELVEHLETLPHAIALLVFCSSDEAIKFETEVQKMYEACFNHALREFFYCVRGTGLEGIFGELPPELEAEERPKDIDRKDMLSRLPNQRQANSCVPGGDK